MTDDSPDETVVRAEAELAEADAASIFSVDPDEVRVAGTDKTVAELLEEIGE